MDDAYDNSSPDVKIGSVRIGGSLGRLLRWTFTTRKGKVFLLGLLLVGIFTAKWPAIRASWIASEMRSPIVKNVYVVEDTRGAGEWLVVRSAYNQHIRLKCVGSMWVDTENNQWRRSSSCWNFSLGEKIKLETWTNEYGSKTYVYKKTQMEGEDDYMAFGED